MENKIVKHGSHKIYNDNDGYMYNFNTSHAYSFNSHLHNCYEFIHIIHGHLIYTVEETDYILSDGDFIMTNPSELHSFRFQTESEYQREFLHIYPGFVRDFPELTTALDSRKLGYFNRFSAEIVKRYGIDKIFRHLESACSDIHPETDYNVLGLTLILFARISRILREETPESQKITLNKKANRITEYIDGHYTENITVDDIAQAAFVSPSHMSRIFKKEMGMTVKTYLNMRRIRRAKNLIMDGRQLITNIYLDSGFRDYSTFYRTFVKFVGMSPEEFKKSQSAL